MVESKFRTEYRMMSGNGNFSKICRCCMENGELNIFTTAFETQAIAKIIETCLSAEISAEDKFPKTICQQCFDKVISCYLFRTNYYKVQIKLKNVLENEILTEETDDRKLDSFDILEHDIDSGIKHESSDDDQPLSVMCKNSQVESSIAFNTLSIIHKHDIHKEELQNCAEYSLNPEYNTCKICQTNFKNKTEFKEHYLKNCTIIKKAGYLKCKHCNEKFSKKAILSQHMRIEHPDKYKIIVKGTKNYAKHLSVTKPKRTSQKHACTDCNEKFEFIKSLEQHCRDRSHMFPRRFSCAVCSKKFLSNTRLNDHMRIHNNERPYECNECGMTFTLSSNLKRHKKRHTGEKSYFCEVCGRGFIQKHTLTVHMRLHNGETPYVCELCGKGYRAKPLLHQHMYKHKDTETQTIKYQKYYLKYGKVKVECKVCKKVITKSALYNHMKVQHGDGLKKFLCNLCGKTYATKMSLDIHMNVHTKKISYDCHVCAKSFTHQNYLKTHLMLHSGERPHCCDLCGKTFVQRTHLDRHMRTHTGARPYICTYCEKAFALNENLKVHIRIHTGETPHHCLVCGKGFFNSSSKKKHETSIHHMHQK